MKCLFFMVIELSVDESTIDYTLGECIIDFINFEMVPKRKVIPVGIHI